MSSSEAMSRNDRRGRPRRFKKGIKLCECGCGLYANRERRLIIGHQRHGIGATSASFTKGHNHTPKGELHPMWKGGKRIHHGYVELYTPEHPAADSRSYVVEHRLVMERHLGRYLTSEEHVHHINKIRTDNRIENLQLMIRSDHITLHAKNRKRNSRGQFI
jgi:hypothetical protein